jgi:hypothetical protein
MVAKTYQQLMTRTLPGVIKGWAKMGYYRDVDYFIGSFAPKKWKWEQPFAPPLKPDYFIHWRNGAGFNFISQDQKGMAAGLSLDAIIGDEAKHLNQELYEEELLPANRGNLGYWGGTHKDKRVNNALHHSILLCSDTPTNQSGRWFIEKQNEHTAAKVQELLEIESYINEMKQKALSTKSKSSRTKYWKEINKWDKKARYIRRGDPERYRNAPKEEKHRYKPTIYFSRANAIDNIEVLGEEYLDQQYRNLPYFIFRTSILNERMNAVQHGFYPDLDDKVHGYDKFNNDYFTNAGYDFDKFTDTDCRQDGDLADNLPIDIACDYGGYFNCMVIGQHHGNEYRLINAMHVKSPEKIRDLVAKFKKYYRFHKHKRINFFYDHTSINSDPIRTTHFHEEYMNLFSQKDEYGKWDVNDIYCGHTPEPEERHEFWSKLLRGNNSEWPRFRYNRHHCEYWAISCQMAPIQEGRNRRFEKGKKSEKQNSNKEYTTPQEEATHYSDAGDTLLYFRLKSDTSSYDSVPGSGLILT